MLTRRQTILMTAAVPLSFTAMADEQPTFLLRGAVTNVANAPVPRGILLIRLEEQGVMDAPARLIAHTQVESDGAAQTLAFELEVPRHDLDGAVDPGFTLRLERDGRLIAINTTKQSYRGETEVSLTLEPIIY